jgi:hypothetical protein
MSSRRAIKGLAMWAMLCATQAQAQSSKSPFDVSFGPQDDGTFGAVLKGEHYFPFKHRGLYEPRTSGSLVSLFAGVEVDGSWNSKPDALNNLSLTLRPSVALQRITPDTVSVSRIQNGQRMMKDTLVGTTRGPWLHIFGDARQRFGDFKDDGDTEPRSVQQLILGGGVQFRWAGFPDRYQQRFQTGKLDNAPTLTFAYHTVVKNDPDDEELPDDITADAFVATLKSALTLPILCSSKQEEVSDDPDDPFENPGVEIKCPFELRLEAVGSKLTQVEDADPEFKIDLGLLYETGGDFKPIIRYRSGDEHGLEYDTQFLFGLLWQLPIAR